MKNISLDIKRFLASLLAVLLSIAWGHVAAAQSGPTLIPPDKIKYPRLSFALPPAERIVLENGIVIYYLENHELPLVNVSAKVKTGTMYDPPGKEGVAELTTYVMRTGGTEKINSAQVDSELDFMASSASISISTEAANIGLSSLQNNFDRSLELLAQMMMMPAFENEKFELARRLKAEDLRRLKDDPQKLAFREFSRVLYRGDPRGRFPSLKSLANITREDLAAFHSRFFHRDNIIFSVSGDITKDEVIKKFSQIFSDWKGKSSFDVISAPAGNMNAGVYVIDKEISQSSIISGRLVSGKNDPDYYAFTVLDFITGSGGFPSRIMTVVRNNEGLAYSAGSFYSPRPQYGVFATYAFTKAPSTIRTLSLMDSVLKNIQSGAVNETELKWARESINNGFIFSFSTPDQIAGQQMNLEFEKLPADFLLNYRDRIENVTLNDLNRTAVKYLDHSRNVVLILGDSKKFDEPLTKIGPYTLITPEE